MTPIIPKMYKMNFYSKNKYGNKKIEFDGQIFDSKKELKRYKELIELEFIGEVSSIERQVKYVLIPKQRDENGKAVRECAYVADFVYQDNKTGKIVVEDVKGFRTKDYKIKWKLMLSVHGITVREI